MDIMELFFCLLFLWCLCSTSKASHLNELSLFEKTADQTGKYTNKNKGANLAIDGDISTFSIAESFGDSQLGWWKVDLGGMYNIAEVSITASIDKTYAESLQSFSIWLLNAREKKLCSIFSSPKRFDPLETKSFPCLKTLPTRYVKIEREKDSVFRVHAIALAEVRVKTRNPAAGNLINQMNVSSSEIYDGRIASVAIDGNKFSYSMSAWYAQELSRGWWEIQFKESYQIVEVIITASRDETNSTTGAIDERKESLKLSRVIFFKETNRKDAQYMHLFSIWLIDEDEAKHLCYKYTSKIPIPARDTKTFPCQNYQLLTRRIRIARDGGHRQDVIALAEVQINTIYC